MKTSPFQIFRHQPVLGIGLAIVMLAGTFSYFSTAESRAHRKAAEKVAAAHVNLMSSVIMAPVVPVERSGDNAAVAVLRAAAASTASLAFVPDED